MPKILALALVVIVCLGYSVISQSAGGVQDIVAGSAADDEQIASPYTHCVLTMGPHGESYGQLAIDIMAGEGAVIKSPINGTVTKLFIDEWGNPSLTVENNRYVVEMLHGLYTVNVGDQLIIGQPVGTESNQGNTYGWDGPCHGKKGCGYHTHINVFDKTLGSNVNPLALFSLE